MDISSETEQARTYLKGKINKTPLLRFKSPFFLNHNEVYLKAENRQKKGSFKIRGIMYKLSRLSKKERQKGVIAFSAGNHALSLAYSCSIFKIPSMIVLPISINNSRLKKISSFNSRIYKSTNVINDYIRLKKELDLTPVHPFDDIHIITGHGTIGTEIMEQLPGVDIVFVPIGGGGLISGISSILKAKNNRIKIIGVEPEEACVVKRSLKNKEIFYLHNQKSIADCLLSPVAGNICLEIVREKVLKVITVSEEEIVKAMKIIWTSFGEIVEPSGAVSFAGFLKELSKYHRKKIVCVISGGNIEKKFFFNIINNDLREI
ncbi:MAG: threonine/serine dehydratase [Candidatus Gastranaerophilaceae bacterium]|jgi:threonine dehydratase